MSGPGEVRPPGPVPRSSAPPDHRQASVRSPAASIVLALGIGLLMAAGWAVLRAILELGTGLLVVAGLGGWGIGAALRPATGSRLIAGGSSTTSPYKG